MKRLVTSVILLISFALSGTAVFADDPAVKEKFYNFDDMLIDGEFKTPQGMYENARDKAKFDRLLKLKKSFLPKIQETSQEEALDS